MGIKIVNTQRAITPNVGKPDYGSCVLHSYSVIVFNVCVKFHESMSSGFKLMKQT